MIETRFIEVNAFGGKKTVAIDQIALIKPSLNGSTIVLKVIKNGENEQIKCHNSYNELSDRIFILAGQA